MITIKFWVLIAIFIAVFIFGVLFGLHVFDESEASGSIVINTLEEDADRYSIVIEDPLEDLPKKKIVVLKVKVMEKQ